MSDFVALSLGAGVQSTTLLLMAAAGEFDTVPDVAIFADTGWEPDAVYRHLAWLESVSTIPIVRVSGGNIRSDLLALAAGEKRCMGNPPLFVRGKDGRAGQMHRQCTRDYKIRPINREIRRRVGPRGTATSWLGISADEAMRMKPAAAKWLTNRYPLIERGLTRGDCIAWLKNHGYATPPKSACIGCPYHRDSAWRTMKDTDALSWADAVEVDTAIRGVRSDAGTFLHRSLVPLPLVDLSTPQDRGQLELPLIEDCEGVCWT